MTGRGRKLAEINARRLKSTIRRVEQQPYDTRTPVRKPRLGGGGGGTSDGYCQLASSLGPATGSWPSITPTTTGTGVTIYTATSSGLVSIGGQVIYNFRNVTWSANKTTYLTFENNIWKIVDQDC